jgi:hypothetical protein
VEVYPQQKSEEQMNGFVKLRRGIAQHVKDGRLPTDEFAAYTILILEADHTTGEWFGNGTELARIMRWRERRGQRVLASLKALGYVEYNPQKGFGGFRFYVRINRYFAVSSEAEKAGSSPVTTDGISTSPVPTDGISRPYRRDTGSSPVYTDGMNGATAHDARVTVSQEVEVRSKSTTNPPLPPLAGGAKSNSFKFECQKNFVVTVQVPLGRKLWRNQAEAEKFEHRCNDRARGYDAQAVMMYFKLQGFSVEVCKDEVDRG